MPGRGAIPIIQKGVTRQLPLEGVVGKSANPPTIERGRLTIADGRNLDVYRVGEAYAPHRTVVFPGLGDRFAFEAKEFQYFAYHGVEVWGYRHPETDGLEFSERLRGDLLGREQAKVDRFSFLECLAPVWAERQGAFFPRSFGFWHAVRMAKERPDLYNSIRCLMTVNPFCGNRAENLVGLPDDLQPHFVQAEEELNNGLDALSYVLRSRAIKFVMVTGVEDLILDTRKTARVYEQLGGTDSAFILLNEIAHFRADLLETLRARGMKIRPPVKGKLPRLLPFLNPEADQQQAHPAIRVFRHGEEIDLGTFDR